MPKRLHALFEGRVQGVGFRFTTMSVASGFKVTGFVRNLPDGDVELVAEGEEAEVSAFLDGLRRSHVFRYVTRERLNWREATGSFRSFDVTC
jgi:acylphosphatase